MQYILIAVVCLWIGYKLGRKMQDFGDLMMARRVAKLVDQREQLEKERSDYDRHVERDRRINKRQRELIEDD